MLRRIPEAMKLLDDKKISTPQQWVKAIKDWITKNIRSPETDNKIPFDEKLMVMGEDSVYIFSQRGDLQSVSLLDSKVDNKNVE